METKSLLNVSSRSATPQTGSKLTLKTTTPQGGSAKVTPQSGRRSMPVSGSKSAPKAPRLVDISGDNADDDDEENEAAITQFGHLKIGFTPGMDGKSRRVRFVVLFTILPVAS